MRRQPRGSRCKRPELWVPAEKKELPALGSGRSQPLMSPTVSILLPRPERGHPFLPGFTWRADGWVSSTPGPSFLDSPGEPTAGSAACPALLLGGLWLSGPNLVMSSCPPVPSASFWLRFPSGQQSRRGHPPDGPLHTGPCRRLWRNSGDKRRRRPQVGT